MKELANYPSTYDATAVHIFDLVYETFVLIGERSDRRDGLLALDVAKARTIF